MHLIRVITDRFHLYLHRLGTFALAFCLALLCSPLLALDLAVDKAEATTSYHVTRLTLYPYTVDNSGKWLNLIDRAKDSNGDWWVKGGIKEKAGQIRMNVEASWSDGCAFKQSDDDWRELDLAWKTSDKSVAVVSSSGLVTATGNGSVTITATDEADGKSADIGIKVIGQAGAYVTAVDICNAKGTPYEEERITFDNSENSLKLYVREEFSDDTTASNIPGADDYDKSRLTTITWSVSDSDSAYVNPSTGVFIPTADALKASGTTSVKVHATAAGGDPDVHNGQVSSYVYVNIKGDGSGGDSLPADSLTVHVAYDKYPTYIVKTLHYTLAELEAMEDVKSTYTFSRSDGEYATASGEGIYLTTLIDKAEISTNQIKNFTFTANDGVNPGKMSYSYLFQARYYWPNYEFSNNKVGAVNVYPMLAFASDWRDSKEGATNCSADYSNLPTKNRLRLLFGSVTSSDNGTDHSLKYISEMTILIDGAPDTTHGDTKDGDGDQGDGTKGKTIGDGSSGGGITAGTTKGTTTSTSKGDVGTSTAAAEVAKGLKVTDLTSSSSKKWEVYQMINPNDQSGLEIDDLDNNPYELLAAVILIAALVAGGLRTGLRFKKQVRA